MTGATIMDNGNKIQNKNQEAIDKAFTEVSLTNKQEDMRNNNNQRNGQAVQEEEEEVDHYAVACDNIVEAPSNPIVNIAKVCSVFVLLYFFICSLDFMATAFRLISGKTTGFVLQNEYIRNPVVGLMIGILVTVLVQSSSTSTSIIVSMVNSRILQVRTAIPMIMGSNIGTSVTNTIVSFTQMGDRNTFRRAFAGATVHDMFNWVTVITMLSIEIPFNLLEQLTEHIVDTAFVYTEKQEGTKIKILKHITEPFTKLIIKIDKKTLEGWSHNNPDYINRTLNPCANAKMDYPDDLEKQAKKCDYVFSAIPLDDTHMGIIMLVISLAMLCLAMIIIVKMLNSMLKGAVANVVKKVINADIPYVPWLTGYVAIFIGALMTFIVQSSSIFTSTLTPLIGLGLITVERSYPLTLGSNVGTTTTALLASIAGEGDGLKRSVQIALVHLFFNLGGICIFYVIPFMRFPIRMAKILGNTTADHRWFALVYLFVMFFLFPAFVFGLSLAGPLYLKAVGLPILVLLAVVVIMNIIQAKLPRILPPVLKNWNFVPKPLRSLDPYDRIFTSCRCCRRCDKTSEEETEVLPHHQQGPNGNSAANIQIGTSQNSNLGQIITKRETSKVLSGLDNPVFLEPPTRL